MVGCSVHAVLLIPDLLHHSCSHVSENYTPQQANRSSIGKECNGNSLAYSSRLNQISCMTGARDGALMVWDSREAARWDNDRQVGVNGPVMVMEDAHKYVSIESARKRKKQASFACCSLPSASSLECLFLGLRGLNLPFQVCLTRLPLSFCLGMVSALKTQKSVPFREQGARSCLYNMTYVTCVMSPLYGTGYMLISKVAETKEAGTSEV